MYIYRVCIYAFRGPSQLITANRKDLWGVILMRADIYMNVSETHICIYVYTHIYKRNLAYESQPDRKTWEGSSSGKRLYTYTHPKRIHMNIYIYIYIYRHTHVYIQRPQTTHHIQRKRPQRGHDLERGLYKPTCTYLECIYIHVYMYTYTYIQRA